MPVDKQGNEIPQSTHTLVGYRESLQLFYSPNNELNKSITIKDEGQTVTTTTTTYCYDAFGRRIGKTTHIKHSSKLGLKGKKPSFGFVSHTKTQTNATLMLWDGNRQFQEYTDTHIFTTIYEQNSFEPVARIVGLATHLEQKRLADIAREINRFVRIGETDEVINQRIADNSKPLINIYHYHNNHLGTPQELTNEQGDVIWLSYDYAWGGQYDTFYKTQAIGNYQIAEHELQPIRFQGQMLDIETGLHYNRFRYYDSDVGMFIQRDPIGLLGGVNVYQYAPNPVGWVDPFGLFHWGNYVRKFGINRDVVDPHGHHIIYKGDFKDDPNKRMHLDRSISIANKYNIPLNFDHKNLKGRSNLMISANRVQGVHTAENAKKVADLLEKSDKRVSEWIKRGVMTPEQADKYMDKQLIRIGGKVFGKYGKKQNPCSKS